MSCRKVLMVAFNFPPAAMSSGHLRTLGFARYLPEHDWQPIVLSATPCAYPHTSPSANTLIPRGCLVHRAPAFDARRHLGIRGKYFGFTAVPDRWASWWPMAVLQGLRLIRQHRIDAVWSTYPIMTAHHIAYTLSRLANLPWIADFRDPVASSAGTDNHRAVVSQQHWEARALQQAARATFTTPGAKRDYARRYPRAEQAGRLHVIQNGYDEADFAQLSADAPRRRPPFVLLHSGLLYPNGRDPTAFFMALSRLKKGGRIHADLLHVVLRASGSEARYQQQINKLDIADIVVLAPRIDNHEALREQTCADGLLLFQGDRFDRQIPAKLYEYLHTGQPIFSLASAESDTAWLLRETGSAPPLPLDDVERIEQGLQYFLDTLASASPLPGRKVDITRWSRRARARELARLLDQVVA